MLAREAKIGGIIGNYEPWNKLAEEGGLQLMELYHRGTSKKIKEKEWQHIEKVEGGMGVLPLMELYHKGTS